jgi:hypothetical protein
MSDVDAIQKLLSRQILSEVELKDFAQRIAELEAEGFKPTDVFPLGIIAQDGAGVQFEVGPDDVGKISDRLIKLGGLKSQLEITSVGIVDNRYRVQATVGYKAR